MLSGVLYFTVTEQLAELPPDDIVIVHCPGETAVIVCVSGSDTLFVTLATELLLDVHNIEVGAPPVAQAMTVWLSPGVSSSDVGEM
jgi:hypothetical protein